MKEKTLAKKRKFCITIYFIYNMIPLNLNILKKKYFMNVLKIY